MSCLVCRQSKFLPPRSEEDCLETALDRVRNHVLFFKNVANEKEQRCRQLQERNEKLTQAVQLLQRQQQQQTLQHERTRSAQGYSPRKKKSKTSASPIPDFSDDNDEDDNKTMMFASQSQLNMALNSQQLQLLDISAHSISPGGATVSHHSDSIPETEKVVSSPRKLQTPAKWQQQQQLQKIDNSNENRNPLAANKIESTSSGGALKKSATISLSKDRFLSFAGAEKQWAKRFIKPQAVVPMSKAATASGKASTSSRNIKKTVSLSLTKRAGTSGTKLQQTRLQVDVVPSFSGAESTFCEDVIDASPNTHAHASTKEAKATRSLLLRTANSSNNSTSCSVNASRSHQNNGQQLLTLNIDSDEDDVFDMSYTTTKTKTMPKEKQKCPTEADTTNLEFALRPEYDAAPTTTENDILLPPIDSSSSSSVVLLTPATQDIIFLDDTTCGGGEVSDDTTQIKSMDLLGDFMRRDNATSVTRLKQFEIERAETSKTAKEELKAPLKIKEENISLENIPTTTRTSAITNNEKEKKNSNREELDDDMPRPMLLKKEPESQKPQQSVQDRFNTNCRDCLNYIRFFGDNMTDAAIEEHLRKCTNHNVMMQNTPDGFWNPHLLSFAPDDPRNEVLIDNRFLGKKRNT